MSLSLLADVSFSGLSSETLSEEEDLFDDKPVALLSGEEVSPVDE